MLDEKDLALLNKPFVASDHKFLNDLIYLHEEPINERLDSVDPAWSFQIKTIVTRDNAGEGGKDIGTVTVHASLIIKGVARDGVGMAVIQRTNPIKESLWDKAQNRKVETGVIYTSEANEAEKSAATDALKRCARMFGIGRYMLTIPKGTVKDEKQLAKWLKEVYGDFQALAKPVYHDEAAAPDPLALDTYLPPSPIPNTPSPVKDKWTEDVKRLTASYYEAEQHQTASLKKAWEEKLIHDGMSAKAAATIMLVHRVEVDYKLSPDEAKGLIINALGMGMSEWLKKNKDDFAKAWQIVLNHIVQASQQPIPF